MISKLYNEVLYLAEGTSETFLFGIPGNSKQQTWLFHCFHAYLWFVSLLTQKCCLFFNNKNLKLQKNPPESKFYERLLVLSQREKLFELAWNLLAGI